MTSIDEIFGGTYSLGQYVDNQRTMKKTVMEFIENPCPSQDFPFQTRSFGNPIAFLPWRSKNQRIIPLLYKTGIMNPENRTKIW